jgi:hypothetical protein
MNAPPDWFDRARCAWGQNTQIAAERRDLAGQQMLAGLAGGIPATMPPDVHADPTASVGTCL